MTTRYASRHPSVLLESWGSPCSRCAAMPVCRKLLIRPPALATDWQVALERTSRSSSGLQFEVTPATSRVSSRARTGFESSLLNLRSLRSECNSAPCKLGGGDTGGKRTRLQHDPSCVNRWASKSIPLAAETVSHCRGVSPEMEGFHHDHVIPADRRIRHRSGVCQR